MTGLVLDQLLAFATAAEMPLLFGLPYDADGSRGSYDLVRHVASDACANGSAIVGYTYGNEHTPDKYPDVLEQIAVGVPAMRDLLDELYGAPGAPGVPLLVAADTGLAPWEVATEGEAFTFVSQVLALPGVAASLDAVSWHFYPFKPADVGTVDHSSVNWDNANTSRLWDPAYLDVVLESAAIVDALVRDEAGEDLEVWLTETDSVCHQGVYNYTNRFGNSLWLMNQWGSLAAGLLTPVMQRQDFFSSPHKT